MKEILNVNICSNKNTEVEHKNYQNIFRMKTVLVTM